MQLVCAVLFVRLIREFVLYYDLCARMKHETHFHDFQSFLIGVFFSSLFRDSVCYKCIAHLNENYVLRPFCTRFMCLGIYVYDG